MDETATKWFDAELSGCKFADQRLGSRFRHLVERLSGSIGASIPLACQDWANTKAAYRFFSNDRVGEADILAGHFQATCGRFAATSGPVLVLQDTTEFACQRERPEATDTASGLDSGKDKSGRLRLHTVRSLMMHSSLAVTVEGLPLGLSAIKFWTRSKIKGDAGPEKKLNSTRVEIEQKESFRWLENMEQSVAVLGDADRCVHIGDRESDIYELFCKAHELGSHFLVRACVDRLAGDGDHTVAAEMQDSKVEGIHKIEVRDDKGNQAIAIIELRYRRIRILPPVGKQKRYPALDLTVIYAQERDTPQNRSRIDWKLITDLPVLSTQDAVEKLNWYAMRWKIEVFHKILKSGCRAEDARLRTAERLTRLIAVFCILAWRIFWMTMLNRAMPDGKPELVITEIEKKLLDHLIADKAGGGDQPKTLSSYLIKIARLGGYLARAKDPPPGNIVMWRGLSRLTDIALGVTIANGTYG